MKMMPEEIALEFRRQLKEDEVLSVTKLMDFLPKEVESRERPVNLSQRQSSATALRQRDREKRNFEKRKNYIPTSASFHVGAREDSHCLFCNKRHISHENAV